MTTAQQIAVLSGIVAGVGGLLVVRALWPRLPHLVSTVQALADGADPRPLLADGARRWSERLGIAILRRWPTLPGVRVPYRELELLGIPAVRYIGERAAFFAAGWIVTAGLGAVVGLGAEVTMGMSVAVAPLVAVAASFIPNYTVTAAAKHARE